MLWFLAWGFGEEWGFRRGIEARTRGQARVKESPSSLQSMRLAPWEVGEREGEAEEVVAARLPCQLPRWCGCLPCRGCFALLCCALGFGWFLRSRAARVLFCPFWFRNRCCAHLLWCVAAVGCGCGCLCLPPPALYRLEMSSVRIGCHCSPSLSNTTSEHGTVVQEENRLDGWMLQRAVIVEKSDSDDMVMNDARVNEIWERFI